MLQNNISKKVGELSISLEEEEARLSRRLQDQRVEIPNITKRQFTHKMIIRSQSMTHISSLCRQLPRLTTFLIIFIIVLYYQQHLQASLCERQLVQKREMEARHEGEILMHLKNGDRVGVWVERG